MYFLVLLVFKTIVILHMNYSFAGPLAPVPPVSNAANSSIPQYRFHYYVKDEKTGDYKAQEEHRTGDSVTGSYMVGEPNGDLRVVTYFADVSNGFKADVSVQPGGSPLRNGTSNVPKDGIAAFDNYRSGISAPPIRNAASNVPKDGIAAFDNYRSGISAPPIRNAASNVPKDGIAAFDNYRSGISAPPKIRKPSRGFNPIVVNSSTSLGAVPPIASPTQTDPSGGHPYPYYKDSRQQNGSTETAFVTSTPTPKKSVQVDLTFNDDAVVVHSEKDTVLPHHRKSSEPTTTTTESNWQLFSFVGEEGGAGTANAVKNLGPALVSQQPVNTNSGIYQLRTMDIPSSVMEILNQNKGNSESLVQAADTTATATSATGATPSISTQLTITDTTERSETSAQNHDSLKIDLSPGLNEATYSTESTFATGLKKFAIPQRPMRLIGLSPIFVDTSQLQTIATENLTSLPQLNFEPFSNMQYATPAPLHSGPLQGGPVGPFRNLPRSVSETMTEYSLINAVPIVNSIPISAPIISQPFAHHGAAGGGGLKQDNKTPVSTQQQQQQQPLSLCSDCLLPANYVPYPLAKPPPSAPSVTSNSQKAPCPPQNTPYWAPYTHSFAYILMPTSIIKSKINETRPFATGSEVWSK